MSRRVNVLLRMMLMALSVLIPAAHLQSAELEILVVMSYEENNPWVEEIREGIYSVLGNDSKITYYYLDTKKDFAGGLQRAREAFELYQQLEPDGVIAADDNAQTMFVIPYLKDKVSTPVVFCGVNAPAHEYGYPSTNVTGILERGHIRESIAFTKQLLPSVESVAFIAKDSPSGRALKKQVALEANTYSVQVIGFHLVKTTTQLIALGEELSGLADTVYVDSVEGLRTNGGAPLTHKQVYDLFSSIYPGAIIGANRSHVQRGALAAVVKTGQEQGEVAARLLLQAVRGTPIAEIPVTRNYHGRRMINVLTLDALGIEARPIVLRGATLVGGD